MASPSFEELLIALSQEHERKINEVRRTFADSFAFHRDAPWTREQPIVSPIEAFKHVGAESGNLLHVPSPTPPELILDDTIQIPEFGGVDSSEMEPEMNIGKVLSKKDTMDTISSSNAPQPLRGSKASKVTRESEVTNSTAPSRETQYGKRNSLKFRNTVRATEMLELVEFEEEHRVLSSILKTFLKYHQKFRELEEPERSGCLKRLVSSQYFGSICMTVILADSLFSVFTSEQQMETLQATPSSASAVIEICFLFFYIFELCLKLAVHRQYFFCNRDMSWNLFDFSLVVQSIVQHLLLVVFTRDDNKSFIFIRVLRILKFGKIFRMFRALKFLRELRVMVMTIIGSFISLFWSIVTLALIVYIFALVFIQEMSGYLIALKIEDKLDAQTETTVKQMFATVAQTMLRLYMCTNNGVDWINVFEVVNPAGPFVEFMFIFFITFFNFAVLNILSGIFLEKALRNSEPDREALALEKRRMDAEDAAALRDLFHQMDWEGNGKLSLKEFECHIADEKVQGYLSALGIDTKDAKMFFDVLSNVNGSEDLEIEDFVDHCSHMKGNASATDMASLSYEVRLLRRELKEGLIICDSGMLTQELSGTPKKHEKEDLETLTRKSRVYRASTSAKRRVTPQSPNGFFAAPSPSGDRAAPRPFSTCDVESLVTGFTPRQGS